MASLKQTDRFLICLLQLCVFMLFRRFFFTKTWVRTSTAALGRENKRKTPETSRLLFPGGILHYDESKAVISVYFFYSNMEVFCVAILSVFLWIIRLKSKQS